MSWWKIAQTRSIKIKLENFGAQDQLLWVWLAARLESEKVKGNAQPNIVFHSKYAKIFVRRCEWTFLWILFIVRFTSCWCSIENNMPINSQSYIIASAQILRFFWLRRWGIGHILSFVRDHGDHHHHRDNVQKQSKLCRRTKKRKKNCKEDDLNSDTNATFGCHMCAHNNNLTAGDWRIECEFTCWMDGVVSAAGLPDSIPKCQRRNFWIGSRGYGCATNASCRW